MNISNSAAFVVAGLIAGVGLTVGVLSKQSPQANQAQVSQPSPTSSPVSSPAAAQQTQPQKVDRLETEKVVFQNVKISRYAGEPPEGVDIAGELYQVTATVTNRTKEFLTPSFSYTLRDDQGRSFEKAAFVIGLDDDGLKTNNGILAEQTREGITIGVFDVLPGATGLELGVVDGMFATAKYVSPPQVQQAEIQPSGAAPVLVSSPVSAIITSAPISFDSLPPCDQLDAVAKSGKSVSDFLVSANRVGDLAKYQSAIGSTCPWNAEQLQVADRIINPPVVVTRTRTVQQSTGGGSSSGSSFGGSIAPSASSGWNNCNGIQEAGESYSARCETAQEMNDAGVGNRWSNWVDERPRMIDPRFSGHPEGAREGPPNGYNGSN